MNRIRSVTLMLLVASICPISLAQPAATNDGRHDFDFLIGHWTVANRLLQPDGKEWKEFTSTYVERSFLDGIGSIDEMTLPKGNLGASIRLFDQATKEWSIYWATSRRGRLELPPVVGHFKDGVGLFYSNDTDAHNNPVRVRFTWSKITPRSARWDEAFSRDGGQTWQVQWTMEFTKTLASARLDASH